VTARGILEMKKVAVLVEDQYQELEVWYPYLRLKEADFDAKFVGTGKGEYMSKRGYPVKEEMAIERADASDFDAVVVPGGYAPDFLRRHDKINSFVRRIYDKGGVTAGICHGGWVLISADVLRGKKATSFFAIKDDMINAGAEWEDSEVVVDGNLVTSRKPDDLPAFLKAIIGLLEG
jgi:protease I